MSDEVPVVICIEGRDKMVKLFQYFTKFCSWYYLKKNASVSLNYFLVSGMSSIFIYITSLVNKV